MPSSRRITAEVGNADDRLANAVEVARINADQSRSREPVRLDGAARDQAAHRRIAELEEICGLLNREVPLR